ncbi:nucleoporin NUP188-like [Lecanosticta acicola]|uniref:Nucleoporin NUP188-like n=1 Tax=Lecanosticta acicola TaxID=111012 RepID=A0AAI8Z4T9_9PEZI|nr:nucleoporin NUP188-like [Lecanosticta acicola]
MPSADSNYFPSLDKCLAGDVRLISWRTAYRAINDEETAIENSHLERFMNDNETISRLKSALDPFQAPDTGSATQFDTKTAPINVSQNGYGDYKLDEIKADAKWLSKEVKIQELVALRMAIIEWQERPADELLSAASADPDSTLNSNALASSVLSKSTLNRATSTYGSSLRPALDFADENVRRRRLLTVFFSEKSFMLKLSADLVSRDAVTKSKVQGHPTGSLREHTNKSWIDEVAKKVADEMIVNHRMAEGNLFVKKCINRFDALMKQVDDEQSWPGAFKEDQTKAQDFVDSQLSEIIQVLRFLLAALYALDGAPQPGAAKAWFTAMDTYGFLQEGRPFWAAMEVPQLLVSIVSLEMLKLHLVIGELMSAAGVPTAPIQGNSYIRDDDCVKYLNGLFHNCAIAKVRLAAPAIYAWSIIVAVIGDIATLHQESRARALEEAPSRSSRDLRSEFEKLNDSIAIPEWITQTTDTPGAFASFAVDEMNLFELITILANAASASLASNGEADTAFICKESLLDLTRDGAPFLKYEAPILEAILSLITYSPSELSHSSRLHANVLAGKLFFDVEQLRPAVIDQALARFPYELSPVLRLFTAFASLQSKFSSRVGPPDAMRMLDDLRSYTQSVHTHFDAYQLEHEEMDSNSIRLTANLEVFVPRQELMSLQTTGGQRQLPWHLQQQESTIFAVPAGTEGTIVKESRPFVFKLEHRYSGVEYLGMLLSTYPGNGELVPSAPGALLDKVTAAEIVGLFKELLTAALKQGQDVKEAVCCLERMSHALKEDQDITTIIANIFETELLAHLDQTAEDGSLELVTACTEFLTVLVDVSPETVWAILARSSLLGLADGATSLASVVGGSEVQIGRFSFLLACVALHESVLEDALTGLVKRKVQGPRTTHRYAEPVGNRDITPERTMSKVLNAFQKILLDVLQNISDWRFELPRERCMVVDGILSAFTRLLRATYGVHAAKDPSERLTNVLAPAADTLLNLCVPNTGVSPLVNTFRQLLPDGPLIADDAISMHLREMLIGQVRVTFDFLTILLRAGKSGIDLLAKVNKAGDIHYVSESENNGGTKGKSLTFEDRQDMAQQRAISLSSELLKSVPRLASLLASDHAFKGELFTLLGELLLVVGSSDQDPPSVLATLGPNAQKSFLQLVTQLDRPLCDVQIERQVWNCLTNVMTSKQQWFAVYLLTGELPKKRLEGPGASTAKGKTILSYVLEQLSSISLLPPERAIGMLKFVAAAQQTWVWASSDIRSHSGFIKNALNWVDTLPKSAENPTKGSSIVRAKELEMASCLCEILALCLQASLEIGDKTLLKSITQRLDFLTTCGVQVNAYNRSLHRSLAANLKKRFPESELSDFQRTAVNPAPLGTDFFYDIDLASSVLGHDPAWFGADPSRDQGFFEEFTRANANLSLVQAQTRLLKSWKSLATTLCDWAEQDAELKPKLATIAKNSLVENASANLDEPNVADLMHTRVQLAFVLISKLVALKVSGQEMADLLEAACNLVRAAPADYDVATVPEDMHYYRSVLQVLYLTVQPHSYRSHGAHSNGVNGAKSGNVSAATASRLVEIVGRVVVPGFRALCGNLHNDMALALPADFALITALLQVILSTPGINSMYAFLTDIVAGSSIIRSALSLYSWSDQLAEASGQDPVYGEVAVMFILALSTIRPIAEQLAIESALVQLSSSNLSNYFRKPGGKGPFDEPRRMFVIWTDGFLPLCLNLLDSVGPPIAAEVAAFLNSFPEQLRRAERSLQNEPPSARNPRAGAITLSLVSEAHSLSIISKILSSDVARAAAEGINAAEIPPLTYNLETVKGVVVGLNRAKRALKDRITPVTSVEESWLKTAVAGSSDNLLQAKVLREVSSMVQFLGSSDEA